MNNEVENINKIIYIVTTFECNSTPCEMYEPKSKMFSNYGEAYHYFLHVAPDINDIENRATQRKNDDYHNSCEKEEYIVIESRIKDTGYYEAERTSAKTSYGAFISLCRF
jgi:hypothetical protein